MRRKAHRKLSCALVFVPLICLCIYSCIGLLGYCDIDGPVHMWIKEKMSTVQSKRYDTIILGDSAANADYVPALLSDRTLNLALSGTTPAENFYILQNWLAHNPPPKTCYISFGDGHLIYEQFFWTRYMYFHLFAPWENFEIVKTAKKYKEQTVITDTYLSDFISYELWLPNKYATQMRKARFVRRYKINIAFQKSVELHSGRYIGRTTHEYGYGGDEKWDSFSVKPFFDDYYRRLLDLCQAKGIKVRIVKLPLPNAVYSAEYETEFWKYHNELKKDRPGVTVDFFPSYETKYFYDQYHMNDHGALRFSTELKALHPEDFTDEGFSKEQAAAVNDLLKIENKAEEILHWINGKDYTVAVCDRTGKFPQFYRETVAADIKASSLRVAEREIEQKQGGQIYEINGSEHSGAVCKIAENGKGIEVALPDGERQVCEPADAQLGLVVIDNYNNEVVCKKTFLYQNGLFVLTEN